MDGSMIPRPFSPTDAKREREEQARLAERASGALWQAGARTAARLTFTNEELQAALTETAGTLTEADAQIIAAQVEADAARVELAAALAASDAAQAQLATDMGTLQNTTLPGLDTDLAAAQGRLDAAETDLESAFGQLGTVDTRIGTAKTDALTSAAVTAQAKADAAAAEAKRQLDVAIASGASLIINGGFESDDIWPLNSAQGYDTTEKRSGARSFKLTPTAGNVWPTNAWFDGATGRTYRCEFWIKRAGTTSTTQAVGAVFQAKTAAGGTSTPIAYPSPTIASLAISDTGYTKVTVDYTITTADVIQVRIAPWVKTAAGNTYWVDDIAAYDITEAKAAEAAAVAAAATTAQAKADAAQAAAITAASADATAKADAAEAAAIAAAAADATFKAESAEAAAAVTAAADAQAKADAAEAAALAAAKAYADAEASGAGADALAAAKLDATAKADAAQAAAITAAALDATAKKEQAEANAAADAKTKADAAQAAAIAAAATTAQAKADAAEAAAITAAAATAQTKADAARDAALAQVNMLAANAGNMAWYGDLEALTPDSIVPTLPAGEAHSGTRAFKTVTSTTQYGKNLPDIPIVPGNWYQFGFWIKASADIPTLNAGMPNTWVTEGGSLHNSDWGAGYTPAQRGVLVPNVWTRVQWLQQAPMTNTAGDQRIAKIRPRFYVWNTSTLGGITVWMDDFSMVDVSAAASALEAAAAADELAGQAHGLAGSAQDQADAALNAATHTGKNLFSTAAPSGTAPYGTIWMQKGAGDVIIGQWQQTGGSAPNATTGLGGVDGSTWTKRDIDNQMIANLDVGKLTANTAAVNNLVAQKIAAATASFQQADIGNLTVTGTSKLADLVAQQVAADSGKFISLAVSQLTAGTGSMAVGVIDKLYSDVVMSRKLIASQVLIGHAANMVPNGNAELGTNDGWPTALTYDSVEKPAGFSASFRATGSTKQGGYTPFPVEPSTEYLFQIWMKADLPNSRFYLEFRDQAGALAGASVAVTGEPFAGSSSYPIQNHVVPTTWTRYSAKFTTTATANSVRVGGMYFNHTNGTERNATVWLAGLTLRPIISGSLVATGAITAPHITASEEMSAKLGSFLKVNAGMLEANLALLTKIIAGPEAGTHAEMSPDGFRVFAADPLGGPAREVVRMGVASTSDFLAVTSPTGSPLATIDEEGKISSVEVHAKTKFSYQGRELADILAGIPRGLAGYGDYYSGVSNISTEYGIFDTLVKVEPGRAYRVTMSGSTSTTSAAGGVLHILRGASTTGATSVAPTLGSGEIKRFEHGYSSALPHPINTSFLWYPTVTVPTTYRVLWSINKYGGGTAVWAGGELMFEDVGLQRKTAGTPNTGGGTTAAPVEVRQQFWNATDSRSYKGDLSWYNFDTGRMYQGYSPYVPANGNLKSMAIFNTGNLGQTIAQALSGATVNWIRVYFNFQHWHNNAGGTAQIGVHSHSAVQASFSSNGNLTVSGGWPKPGARWVDLPSTVFAGFKAGTYKGVTLEGDGTSNTYGYADRPTIEINYTK